MSGFGQNQTVRIRTHNDNAMIQTIPLWELTEYLDNTLDYTTTEVKGWDFSEGKAVWIRVVGYKEIEKAKCGSLTYKNAGFDVIVDQEQAYLQAEHNKGYSVNAVQSPMPADARLFVDTGASRFEASYRKLRNKPTLISLELADTNNMFVNGILFGV